MEKNILKRIWNGFLLITWLYVFISLGTWGLGQISESAERVANDQRVQKAVAAAFTPSKSDSFTADGSVFNDQASLEKYFTEKGNAPPGGEDLDNKAQGKSLRKNSDEKKTQAPPMYLHEGIPFSDLATLIKYIEAKQKYKEAQQNASMNLLGRAINICSAAKQKFFSYLNPTNRRGLIAVNVLTAISFGIVGAVTATLKRVVGRRNHRIDVADVDAFFFPVFGGLIGFAAYGITELMPMILQTNTELNVTRPATLFFFCFFSGMASEEMCSWGQQIVLNFLRQKKE